MVYRKYQPAPHWAPFVECYFVWENDTLPQEPLEIESPPSGFTSIVFNYRDPYFLRNTKYARLSVPQQFIAGQSIYAYTLTLPGTIGMAGIVFKPAALATLFGLAMYEFVEERVDLRTVFPAALVDRYAAAFIGQDAPEAKASLLEQFLQEMTDPAKAISDYIDVAANEIVAQNGLVQLSKLVEKSCTSRRTFERNFFNKVGLSPKFFSRIRRISYICNQIAGKKEVNWPKIYFENAFYDHSHFIRDFEEFIGRAPGQYIKDNHELIHHVEKPSFSPIPAR